MLDRRGGTRRWHVSALTERQREVLQLVVDGVATQDIARRLSIGPGTVRRHLRTALARLGEAGRSVPLGGRGDEARAPETRTVPGRRRRQRGRPNGGRVLTRELQRAAEGTYALSILFVSAGPEEGPAAGDLTAGRGPATWTAPASGLVQMIRRQDWTIPWAPDQYLVILIGTDLAGAMAVASRLRAAGRGRDLAIGAAQWQAGESSDALVSRAQRSADQDRLQRDAERALHRAIRQQ